MTSSSVGVTNFLLMFWRSISSCINRIKQLRCNKLVKGLLLSDVATAATSGELKVGNFDIWCFRIGNAFKDGVVLKYIDCLTQVRKRQQCLKKIV